MLTLYTVPKPFRGHIGVIQRNAILSWLQLRPECEIILFGDEEGTAELAASIGVRHVPDFNRNKHGTPLLDSVFETAQQLASNELMVYINADIILMSDFLDAVSQIRLDKFLMIGQRWDLDITEPLDFNNPNWEAHLRDMVREHGFLHPPSGVDYYLFPKGLFGKIPPFAIGRTAYDQWFIFNIRSLGVPVIDATSLVTNIHQNHERTYASVGLSGPQGETNLREGIESERNVELAGGLSHLFTLKDANWILTSQGIKRAISLRHIYFQMRAIPILYPKLHFLLTLFKILEKIIITIRQKLR